MKAPPRNETGASRAPVVNLKTDGTNHTPIADKINDWEIRIGEAAEVAPPLDPNHRFFSITKADMLIVVEPSDGHDAGYYVITSCRITRDDEGDICGVEPVADELRPLKGHAVGIFLESFGCTKADTWLRLPLSQERVFLRRLAAEAA